MAVKCAAWIACVLAKPVSVAMTSSSLSKTRSHVFSPRSFSSRDFIDAPSRPEARRRTAPSLSNNAVHRTCRRMSLEEVETMAHVVALVLALAARAHSRHGRAGAKSELASQRRAGAVQPALFRGARAGTGRSVPRASLFVRPDRRHAGTPIPLSRQAWSQA